VRLPAAWALKTETVFLVAPIVQLIYCKCHRVNQLLTYAELRAPDRSLPSALIRSPVDDSVLVLFLIESLISSFVRAKT
jgi:hypothetical protein